MSCPFEHDAGAYVLGALSASDRRAFEQHLRDCPSCSRAVAELAGIPGLLGRVSPDLLEDEPTDGPAPADSPPNVLPRLLSQVRRERRRRTWTAAGAAAAAVLAVGTGSWVVAEQVQGDPGQSQAQRPALAAAHSMTRVGDVAMNADLRLTTVPWGTRLDLACSYPEGHRYHDGAGSHEPWTMVLVVHTRDGGTEQVATWHARSGVDMTLTAATAVAVSDIASVEVRTAAGAPVMRLDG